MKRNHFSIFIPLAFMAIGMTFLFWCQHEFQRRADRDNAELRQDLNEAGLSKAEFAALLSAQTKMQANASAYTQSSVFIVFMLSIFSSIPIYARLASDGTSNDNATHSPSNLP